MQRRHSFPDLRLCLPLMIAALALGCSEDDPMIANQAPTVANPIADLELVGGFETETISLAGVFADADEDQLSLSARSSNPEVATVQVDGTSLTMQERGAGETTITVTADDGNEGIASDEFTLTVGEDDQGGGQDGQNSTPTVATALGDLTLTAGFATQTVDLTATFDDEDGDELTLTSVSSDEAVVTVAIAAGELTITEVGTGSATVTITATDPDGGSVSDDFSVTVNAVSQEFSISFGTSTGSQITIDSWAEVSSASGYIVVVNTSDSFTDRANGDDPKASTTYIGTTEQVVFNGSDISAVTVSLLQDQKAYFFKVFSFNGNKVYDSSLSSAEASTGSCETSSTTISQVCFEVDVAADTRTISANQFPSHETGSFPNADPTAIAVTRVLDLTPALADEITYVYDETGGPTPSNDKFWQFGMATNGVEFHPMGLKPWENPNTGEENWEWQAQVSEEGQTGLDEWGAHVTTQGNYHYHGDVIGLASDEDGSRHSLIYGFAADGFPIYYKYSYTSADDATTAIKELKSSYRLKSGSRPGDGTTAPDGSYDGTYIQDYEYVAELGDLDECNGRSGVTPEYPGGTYYYVITGDFPRVSNCFRGTPDDDWKIGK